MINDVHFLAPFVFRHLFGVMTLHYVMVFETLLHEPSCQGRHSYPAYDELHFLIF